jgi:hypothetical protein
MKLLTVVAITAATASVAINVVTMTKTSHKDCIRPGDIRYHNGRPCVIERVSVDGKTGFIIVDESLLEQL